MKTTIHSLITLTCLLFFITNNVSATYYTTLQDGTWNNTDRVWSTDGATPCMCTPGETISEDTVVVNKMITMTYKLLIVSNGIVGVASQGRLSGPYNIDVSNGNLNIYGHMSFQKLEIGLNSDVMLNNATLTLTNRLDIFGSMIVDNGYLYMTGGNLTIQPFGQLLTLNNAKIDVAGGNIENYGHTDICADCCMTTLGNWKNLISKEGFIGSVTGSGSAQTTAGNMNNDGFWSTSLTWCSVGFDTGMPTPEGCDESNGTCNSVLLPVELTNFDVSLNKNNDADIIWKTATELNSDYFEIQKSKDINNWEIVDNIDAAGSSSTLSIYSTVDRDVAQNITYYRLRQVDINGTSRYSQIKAISNNSVNGITVYPNPATTTNDVTVTNIDERDIITVKNSAGKILIENSDPGTNGSRVLDIDKLQPGVYFISNQSEPKEYCVKLMITQ